MLEPDDIRNKQFTTTRVREGYDQAEVDVFLDTVEADYRNTLAELADTKARLQAAQLNALSQQQTQVLPPVPEQPPTVGGPSLESIALLLQQAEVAAADIKTKAEVEAAAVLADAQSCAVKTLADAHAQADAVAADGVARRNAAVGEMQAKVDALQGKVDALNSVHADVYNKLADACDTLAPEEAAS